jgi:hypothetical protein
MAFKPLTSNKTALKAQDKPEDAKVKDTLRPMTKEEIVRSTEERIKIIYDDSGSMDAHVDDGTSKDYSSWPTRIALAAEGTTDYMKNCKPHSTAIEVSPLNAEVFSMTKNLPVIATKLKALSADGGTPLFGALRRFYTEHETSRFTRGLIFTDGEAGDSYSENVEKILNDLLSMKIPIDFIIIGNKNEVQLNPSETQLKGMAERSGGTFLICKTAADFKKKLKYFAPLLRHMLPAIASADDRG